ncbi:MAG TPA: PilZ domain-containing protein [Polyangiaceae bacterium]|nr:PilZ domain-containing protein [Polyangiaceae bacterium]
MLARPMLLYGQFPAATLDRIDEAAKQAACSLTRAETIEQALAWLEGNEAHAVLCNSAQSENLAVQTRSRSRWSKLPVLALAESLGDLEFISAFSWGADDVVRVDSVRPLAARLRALPKEAPSPPLEKRGEALVAETEHTRRIAVARVLRNAGFAIRFAVTASDADAFAQDPSLTLVVVNKELFTNPVSTIQAARAANSQASFIICSAPRDLKQDRTAVTGLSAVTVTDGYTAPENVLFVANELTNGRVNNRASPRVPYGTSVAFRSAGRDHDEHGFSYNASEKGLYVRSLFLPEDDEVWLELCLPRMERRVRLVGRVAWRRPFNYSDSATVPPGFGVELMDGAAKDRALWCEGYNKLIASIG